MQPRQQLSSASPQDDLDKEARSAGFDIKVHLSDGGDPKFYKGAKCFISEVGKYLLFVGAHWATRKTCYYFKTLELD